MNIKYRVAKLEEKIKANNQNELEVILIGWEGANFADYSYPPTPDELAACGTSRRICRWVPSDTN